MPRRLALVLLVVLLSGCLGKDEMTFEVEVPRNTMEGYTVHIYTNLKDHKMERVGDYTYRISLPPGEL